MILHLVCFVNHLWNEDGRISGWKVGEGGESFGISWDPPCLFPEILYWLYKQSPSSFSDRFVWIKKNLGLNANLYYLGIVIMFVRSVLLWIPSTIYNAIDGFKTPWLKMNRIWSKVKSLIFNVLKKSLFIPLYSNLAWISTQEVLKEYIR